MKKFTYSLLIAFAAILFSGTAFGQITTVGTATTASSTTGSITISKPTGIQVGDLMIASIVESEASGGTDLGGSNGLTGWTLMSEGTLAGTNPEFYGYAFYKIAVLADVTASDYTFDLDGSNNAASGSIIAFRGVNNTTPFDVTPGASLTGVNTDNSLSPTAISPISPNTAIVMLGFVGLNTGTGNIFSGWNTTSPGGLAELVDFGATGTRGRGVGAAWATKASTGTTGPTGTATLAGNYPNGSLLIALRPFIDPVPNPNLWSVSGTGDLRKYTMDPIAGTLLAGPATVVTPLTSTAAVAKNQITPNDVNGCIYYLDRDDDDTKNGVVTIYSLRPDGTGHGSRGTIDMNGPANNSDFSFVRLGFDALGRGWILAGTGGTIYIASFQGNGVNAISGVNTFGNATLNVAAPGAATDFQNGDLAITANGTMYAVANVTDGETYVYVLNSLNTPTTLTRKWTVQQGGNTFSGSVNGLAWTQSGSLHFSTSTGIYFIDQFTANTNSGTVQATLVANTGGLSLTDLGSDRFPTQTTLPVDLISFAGAYSNQKTNLNWVTENLQDFDRFEVERSTDGSNFATVATKAPVQTAARTTYLHTDDLSAVNGTVFYYRLKMIALNGQFKYSNVILVRKESNVKGIRINPNPVVTGGVATLRFEASAKGVVEFRIVDMAGRIVLRQQNNVAEGINSVPVNSLDRLQPGTYILQMNDGTTIQSTKFIVAQ